MKAVKAVLSISFITSISFAFIIAHPNRKPYPIPTGDEAMFGEVIPYSPGDRQSPGVQIGVTYYDLQRQGSFGQRLAVDDSGQIHVNWTYCSGEYPGSSRFIRWNFRSADGTCLGIS